MEIYELKFACINNNCLTKPEVGFEESVDDIFEDELFHGQELKATCTCKKSTDESNVKVDDILLKSVLGDCLPESSNNPTVIACNLCLEALQHRFQFVTSCLQTEEIIRSYRLQSTSCQQFVNLFEVQQNTFFNPESSSHTIAKLEAGTEEFNTLLGINTEVEFSFQDQRNEKEHQEGSGILPEKNWTVDVAQEDLKHADGECRYEISITSHKNFEGAQEYRCERCSYQSDRKSFLNHINKHKKEQVTIFNCGVCKLQANHIYAFLSHLPIHEEPAKMLKCSICSYEGTQTRYLMRHMSINHALESPTFKCDRCAFKTKHRTALLNHLLIHKDPSQVPTYKCKKCAYETKHKRYLNRHVLTHKRKSEVRTYTCDICSYKAKRKDVFRAHMLNHMKNSNSKTYNCQDCDYETKYKHNLKTHQQSHQVKSEESLTRRSS